MRKMLIASVVLLGGLALAQAVQRSLNLTIQGASSSEKAIVVNGKSYVPVGVLKSLGVNATLQNNTLALSRAADGSAPAAGGTAGTQQLAGGVGAIGQAVTLGKESPLNFTLRSLEYQFGRVSIGSGVWEANAKQKLLLLRFTVQNPQKNRDVLLNHSSFLFTLVDSNNVSSTPAWAASELQFARDNDSTPLETPLKPGQRLDAYTVFVVPREVSVPKLIVERFNERSAGVLRYDLGGKIKPLPAPFAADSNGFKAIEELNAKIGTYYPLGLFDLRLESAGFATSQPADLRPSEGKRFVTLIFGLRNPMPRGAPNADFSLCGERGVVLELTDADGERQTSQTCLANFWKVSREESGDGSLAPGQETRVRFYFEVPNHVAMARLMVSSAQSIRYVFDLGATK
jgi:hypothetical protein